MFESNPSLELDRSKDEVRLIKILPDTWNACIHCELFIVSLSSNPAYKALSYAWGNRRRTVPIVVNKQPLNVAGNLEAAMRRLRQPTEEQIFWIDAICIDQTNPAERNHQVRMMHSIFQKASELTIWLGEETVYGTSEQQRPQTTFITSVSTFYYAFRTRHKHYRRERNGWYSPDQQESETKGPVLADRDWKVAMLTNQNRVHKDVLQAFHLLYLLSTNRQRHLHSNSSLMLHLRQPRVITALQNVVSSAWWQRMWVVQETVVSKTARVIYGSVIVPWLMLVEAAVNYAQHADTCCRPSLNRVETEHWKVLPRFTTNVLAQLETRTASSFVLSASTKSLEDRLISSMWVHGAAERTTTLLWLLRRFRARHASDGRDKVFALIGLVTDWQDCPKIKPDYRSPKYEVYRYVSENTILGTKLLDILQGFTNDRRTRRHTNLPSWVTDWSESYNPSEFERLQRLSMYTASAETKAHALVHGHSILALQGFLVDRVMLVWEPVKNVVWESVRNERNERVRMDLGFNYDMIHSWGFQAYEFGANTKKYHRKKFSKTFEHMEKLGNEFWRTICADTLCTSSNGKLYRRAAPTDKQTFQNWLNETQGYFREATSAASTVLADDISRMDHSVRAATAGRRFFVTEKGRFGLGPIDTRKRDEVWILYGGSTPFLLRPGADCCVQSSWESGHELVGDSFIHGIMDGETMEEHSKNLKSVYLI